MPQPNKIPKAFAASGDRNIIPESTGALGLVSWNEGFPAITSTPFSEGGIAPKRADFNGIFNALSLATLWQQQGGFYAYDNATDYEVGNVVLYSGDLYKCLSANGPSSAVKAPTDATVWAKVILTTATTSAAGYMSAEDKKAVDGIASLGTFNKILFYQTSGNYTAPRTGVYRIWLRGGGGGGGYGETSTRLCMSAGGGGQGGLLIFYKTLIKNTVYPYVIGAGGAGAEPADYRGGDGGATSFNNDEYIAPGGTGGVSRDTMYGGTGGRNFTYPSGEQVIPIGGANGQSGIRFPDSISNSFGHWTSPGAGTGFGAGGNSGFWWNSVRTNPSAGSPGCIFIEYAG